MLASMIFYIHFGKALIYLYVKKILWIALGFELMPECRVEFFNFEKIYFARPDSSHSSSIPSLTILKYTSQDQTVGIWVQISILQL